MSYARASIISRLEDYLVRLLRKLSPSFERKLMMLYLSSGGSRIEERAARSIIFGGIRVYRAFSSLEPAIVNVYRSLVRGLSSIQASLEDIVSFASSYMSLLFVISLVSVVVVSWILYSS